VSSILFLHLPAPAARQLVMLRLLGGLSAVVLFSAAFRRPRGSTLFPYTTLFRSCGRSSWRRIWKTGGSRPGNPWRRWQRPGGPRSEEHTSELQSRFDLVCRLLLEKKKELLEHERYFIQ